MNSIIFEESNSYRTYISDLIHTIAEKHSFDVEILLETSEPAGIISFLQNHALQPVVFFLGIMADGSSRGLELAYYIRKRNKPHTLVFIMACPFPINEISKYMPVGFNVILKDSPAFEAEIEETLLCLL